MRYCFMFCVFLSLKISAQSPYTLQIETSSGYEHNVFNGYGGNRIATSNKNVPQAKLSSGFFQRADLQFAWKKEFGAHAFAVKNRLRYTYFPQELRANLFRPQLSVFYQYSVNKKLSFFVRGSYLRYKTNRQANETEVAVIPSSYHRGLARIGTKFLAAKRNKISVELLVLQKNYATDRNGRLRYQAFGLNVQSKQQFKQKGKPSTYLSFVVDVNRRVYWDQLFENIEGEEEEAEFELGEAENNRIWQYHTVKLVYTIPVSKKVKWKVGTAFQERLDLLEGQFGYRQLQGFVELSLKIKKMDIKWRGEAFQRRFKDLFADEEEDFLLKHHYLRSTLRMSYQLDDQWSLTSLVTFKRRWRNFPQGYTISYLPYTNALISFGIKYKF